MRIKLTSIMVDDQDKVVGMVSDNDLLTRGGMKVTISLKRATDLDYVRGLHDSLENPHHKVSEVMTRQVVTITPDAILARAARLMVEKHLKRLPVVDSDGKLVKCVRRSSTMYTEQPLPPKKVRGSMAATLKAVRQ